MTDSDSEPPAGLFKGIVVILGRGTACRTPIKTGEEIRLDGINIERYY
jgi:hypothetical protein